MKENGMPWSEMSLEDRMPAGEYNRRRLIRFGYLSEAERRRLVATYDDLEARFEPEPDPDDPIKHALFIYVALIFGIALGAQHFDSDGSFISWYAISGYILTTILYWAIAASVLKKEHRSREERTERYWEWRGYRCDKHGRKIG